tara:strand:+ start:2810 stop:2992 length:183 start_codon:yes stop_codon:yes gene_type:complete
MPQYRSDHTGEENFNYKYKQVSLFDEEDTLKIFDKVYELKFNHEKNDKFQELLNWIDEEF